MRQSEIDLAILDLQAEMALVDADIAALSARVAPDDAALDITVRKCTALHAQEQQAEARFAEIATPRLPLPMKSPDLYMSDRELALAWDERDAASDRAVKADGERSEIERRVRDHRAAAEQLTARRSDIELKLTALAQETPDEDAGRLKPIPSESSTRQRLDAIGARLGL